MKTQATHIQGAVPKWMLTSFTILTLAVIGTETTRAQLLNGNLDQTYQQEIVPGFFLPKPANWVNFGSRTVTGLYEDEMSSETWAGPAPTPVTTGGVNSDDWAVFFKPFTGNLTTGDLATGRLYQDVPGTAGLTYRFTGWAGAEANYSGLISGSVTKSQFTLQFLDAGNNVLSSAILDLVAAGLGTPNGQPFNYQQFAVQGTAPAGTAFIRAGAGMIDAYANPAGGGQAFVVDDFALTIIPEPSSLALVGLGFLALARLRRTQMK